MIIVILSQGSIRCLDSGNTLILKVQKIVKCAHVDIGDLKQLLILSYQQFESMIQEAKTIASVFVIVRELCSSVNIEVLIVFGNHFELSGTIEEIQAYELEEQSYCKKAV